MAPTLVWGVVAHTFPFLPPLAAPTPTEKNLGKDPLAQGRRAGVGRGRGSAVVPPTLSKLGQVELRRGDGVEGGGLWNRRAKCSSSLQALVSGGVRAREDHKDQPT